jgi:hypothetical protein
MRARSLDVPPGAGAAFGLARGLVGIGDDPGEKAARMARRLGDLPDGTFVWTRDRDGLYWLGRIAGPARYDDSPAAREAGIHHVRPATWLERPFGEDDAPAGVVATFARGGRNMQRIRDAERETPVLWEAAVTDPAARRK